MANGRSIWISEPAAIPAELWEEDSVCGDFLRAVRELQQQPESWRKLETYLPAEPVRDVLLDQLKQTVCRATAATVAACGGLGHGPAAR